MKYSRDLRYSDGSVATHDMKTHAAIPCERLLPHVDACLSCDLVGVDEGQFFPDLLEFVERLTGHGKTVIVAGLDGSFQRKRFGRIVELISKSESIDKLSAVCTVTGGEACFTKRTIDSQELEVIGGADIYCAASRSAFVGHPTKGEVHLTLGPVKSGKTTELCRILNRHRIAGRKAVLLRPSAGSPGGQTAFAVRTVDSLPLAESLSEFDAVGVDEGHRFEGLSEWADGLANGGKLVEIAALDGNYDGVAFEGVVGLVSVCERVRKLDSVCPLTGLPAPFSALQEGVGIPVSRVGLLQVQRPRPALEVAV
jgi:thymidine kinase